MSKKAFDKFIQPNNASRKEAMRREKREAKADMRAQGEEMRKKKLDKQRGIESPEDKTKREERQAKHKGRTVGENGKAGKRGQEPRFDKRNDKPAKEEGTFEGRNDKKLFLKRDGKRSHAESPETKTGGAPFIQKKLGDEKMPLNKYIAHAGVCARREAAELVKEGKVQVNNNIIYEPGFKVSPDDKVKVKGKLVHIQKNLVYILLNKPKDYITTLDDPQGRKTVLDLIKGAVTNERVYPVGRLDRNTTGVLLITNDGELAQKLTHPSFEVKKIYEVTLDKPLAKNDGQAILDGVELEDGLVKADAVGYVDARDKNVVGVQIHSGRNRIVRRIFEHLGYNVKNLDRVMFANLTKKNVERGKWRYLNEKEVRLLKFMNQSFIKKAQSAKPKA
ncbi:pseudouridine synthase [Danxiaibacter flavus]|uniref:Pseudouridine synthase n=1 Tax=Danxiaibacter flavus TaxID=3049108 RepID=A0ABV3ZER4_9BACT|nr:pseudouridine synthase [Chitinophagaceae bacterium DXS]